MKSTAASGNSGTLADDADIEVNETSWVHASGYTQSDRSTLACDAELGETRAWVAGVTEQGARFDKVIALKVPEFSRNYVQGLIEAGHAQVDGCVERQCAKRVRLGQVLQVRLVPTQESRAFRPEPLPMNVVFEDADVLVLDKRAGWVVHPAPGNWSGTVLNAMLARNPESAALPRAGIVHRLVADTSGLMVLAKTRQSMTVLTRAIAAREVKREYLALSHRPDSERQLPDKPLGLTQAIGRDPRSRVRMAVVGGGKAAYTEVEVLGSTASFVGWHCRLQTGRTHQIRVHLSHHGYPLVADELYGGRIALGMKRQALHAWRLGFEHPLTGQWMQFNAPLPEDMASAWTVGLGVALQ